MMRRMDMRFNATCLIACAGVIGLAIANESCRRSPPSSAATEENPATTPPATNPASEISTAEPGVLAEPDLIRFIAACSKIVLITRSQGHEVEASGEGFIRLSRDVQYREPPLSEIFRSGFTLDQWVKTGSLAWSAWSVAQVDYNAEAPLREQAAREADARRRLAIAQETQKRGVWVLSDSERAQRVVQAKDDQASALRRAEEWARQATDLERQVGEAQSAARKAGAVIGDGVAGQAPAPPDPFGPPADRVGPPGALADGSHDADSARAAQDALAYAQERRHELDTARQHEADERQRAREAAAVVANPVVPVSAKEKAALLSDAAKQIQSATIEIESARAEQKRFAARLADERRADRAERRKAATEGDIALLRKHLAEFNAAWGMKVNGRTASTQATPE